MLEELSTFSVVFRRKIDHDTRAKIFTDSKFSKQALKMIEKAYKELKEEVTEGEPVEEEYEMDISGYTLKVIIAFFEKRGRRHCNFDVREILN